MIKRLALLASISLLFPGCGKKPETAAAAPSASVVEEAPVTLEDGGEADPIASPAALKGGSLTTWAGGYPKSLNMWLDYNSFSVSVCGLMFEPLVTLHPTKDEPVGWSVTSGSNMSPHTLTEKEL